MKRRILLFIIPLILSDCFRKSPQVLYSTDEIRLIPTQTLKGCRGDIISLSFSPDGRYLASGTDKGEIKIWDTSIWRPIKTFSPILRRWWEDKVSAITFSPDGRYLVVAENGGYQCDWGWVRVWDTQGWNLVKRVNEPTTFIQSLLFSPDGEYLVIGGKEIVIRETEGWGKVKILGKFRGSVALTFSKDGELLAATDGRIARVWEREGWREVALLYPLEGANSIAFSPEARYLAIGMGVCEGKPCCEIWDTSTWERIKRIKTRSAIACVRFYHKYLLGGRWGGCIATCLEHPEYIFDQVDLRIWETKSWRLIYAERLNGEVWCMDISPEGKRIAIGSGRDIFIREIGL